MTVTSKATSTKYEAAVNRATGKATETSPETGITVPLHEDAKTMLLKPSQEQIDAMMSDPTLEFAPQVHSLEEGELITGILEGNGPSTTFTQKDNATGIEITREVDTWIIRHPLSGLRLSILSSVQLDTKLPPFVNGTVSIFRGKDVKTSKGFRVTNYTVAGPKKADGTIRSWVRSKIINAQSRVIDGQVDQAQIPASTGAPAAESEDARA